MSEPKNLKICKELKKAFSVLAEEINQCGGDINIDSRTAIETSGDEESLWLSSDDIQIALSIATAYNLNPNICCAILELASLFRDVSENRNLK
jgi:hypothetical protein